ncbi:MAG: helix-turn-helix domain-containing protein [Halanaerobiaceae bacterium]
MKKDNRVKSVVKSLRLYEEIIKEGKPISLSKLSEKTDINISTAYRGLSTLVKLDYIQKNSNKLYSPGLKSYKISCVISRNYEQNN